MCVATVNVRILNRIMPETCKYALLDRLFIGRDHLNVSLAKALGTLLDTNQKVAHVAVPPKTSGGRLQKRLI